MSSIDNDNNNSQDSLSYTMIEGDPTVSKILEEEQFYGYEKSKPLQLDDSFIELYDEIIRDRSILYADYFLRFGANKEFVKKSLALWGHLGIKLKSIDILDEKFMASDGDFEITQEFLDSITTSSPKHLPIHLTSPSKNQKLNAQTNLITMASPSGKVEDNGILYSNIILPSLNNVLTSSIYAHEITHTQINSKDQCGNILNTETLPILLGEIFAYQLDKSGKNIERMRNLRLKWLVTSLYRLMTIKNMAYSSKMEIDTYIQSTIQAIKLSNIYMLDNINIKKSILEYIKMIIEEEASLKDMLDYFDANFADCSHELKDLKILHR